MVISSVLRDSVIGEGAASLRSIVGIEKSLTTSAAETSKSWSDSGSSVSATDFSVGAVESLWVGLLLTLCRLFLDGSTSAFSENEWYVRHNEQCLLL